MVKGLKMADKWPGKWLDRKTMANFQLSSHVFTIWDFGTLPHQPGASVYFASTFSAIFGAR